MKRRRQDTDIGKTGYEIGNGKGCGDLGELNRQGEILGKNSKF